MCLITIFLKSPLIISSPLKWRACSPTKVQQQEPFEETQRCSSQKDGRFETPNTEEVLFLPLYSLLLHESHKSQTVKAFETPSITSEIYSMYSKRNDHTANPLSIKHIWNRELTYFDLSINWERVWSNLTLTSENLAHRIIYFKVIHRAYITPYTRFKTKLQSTYNRYGNL